MNIKYFDNERIILNNNQTNDFSQSSDNKINEKYQVNIAFEGGEAETLAIDGPIFKKRIKILKDKKEWHLDSGVYIIEDAVLEEKL